MRDLENGRRCIGSEVAVVFLGVVDHVVFFMLMEVGPYVEIAGSGV